MLVAKEAKKEIKSFEKIRKYQLKEIEKLGKLKSTSSSELFGIYTIYNNAKLNMQTVLISKRLKLQQLISDEEWKQLIESAVLPSDKALKKIDKQDNKEADEVEKLIQEIETTIISEITEANKQENLLNSLEKFHTTLKEFVDESQRMNFKDNKLIRDKNASREDLENFYKKQNELRHKGTVEYFQLRNAEIKNTNQDEWNKIIKSLMSIVKS